MRRTAHISSYILRARLISLLLLLPVFANAQKPRVIEEQKDTVPLFRGVAVSVDMAGLGQIAFSSYGQYEVAARLNLNDKYFPVIEVGIGKANAKDDGTNVSYKTSAPYARVGLDLNLLKNKHDDYRLYGGLRYAYTKYKYDVSSPDLTDPVWGDQASFAANGVSCSFQWFELVFGVDAKIWKSLRLGWSVRYRHVLFHDDGDLGNTWYVPGFGKAGTTALGGTFNVIFEL